MSSSVSEYSNHWKSILYMELRGSVSDAINAKFPSIKNGPEELRRSIFSSGFSKFIMVQVRKVNHSKLLTNFLCESTDVQLNKKIVRDLAGMTLCFGYFRRADDRGDSSKLVTILCRRVHVDEDDFDRVGLSGKVDKLFLRLCTNRVTTRLFAPGPGDFLYIQAFYSVASVVRMFRASHLTCKLPVEIQNVLFGRQPPRILAEHVKLHNGRHDVTNLLPGVDPGSLRYLRDLLRDPASSRLNQHQFEALVIALERIGDADVESSSMSMILGPPGTGKTTCITLLIGALLYHSVWGHVGVQGVHNELQRSDGLVRCSKKDGSFKILVCCSSNQGVDNVLRKLQNGIPDGKGGKLFVQCVRVARQNYEYKDLEQYSMNKRALPFDLELFERNTESLIASRERTMPSLKAKRALARECIIFLFTNSLSGGSKLAELKADCDIVIKDEVSQSLEPESLIPLTATRKVSKLSRLHFVGVGDFNQLPPLSMTEPLLTNTNVPIPFNYAQQVVSQFERMFVGARCARAMLMAQYRMHPTISLPHSRQFYRGIISNPSPISSFEESYNQREKRQVGFYPLTFWDTCLDKTRLEQDKGDGMISNEFEANLVDKAIRKLISLEGFERLRGKIAVIAPYRAQVDVINFVLQSPLRSLHTPASRYLDVLVCTVDSMQGSERDIVIFSGSRSNVQGIVGFLDNPKRLNVAVSRARKLLLIIGDSETLFNVPMFRFFIESCRRGRDGAGLVMMTPSPGNEIARPQTRGSSLHFHRRRTGYALRSLSHGQNPVYPGRRGGRGEDGVVKPGWRVRHR